MSDTPTTAVAPVQPPPGEERIYKYELDIIQPGWYELTLPKGARILHVGLQAFAGPALWASVDPSAPVVKRTLQMCYTGQGSPLSPIPGQENPWRHIGTVVMPGGLVFHYFLLNEDWAGGPKELGKVIPMNILH